MSLFKHKFSSKVIDARDYDRLLYQEKLFYSVIPRKINIKRVITDKKKDLMQAVLDTAVNEFTDLIESPSIPTAVSIT